MKAVIQNLNSLSDPCINEQITCSVCCFVPAESVLAKVNKPSAKIWDVKSAVRKRNDHEYGSDFLN